MVISLFCKHKGPGSHRLRLVDDPTLIAQKAGLAAVLPYVFSGKAKKPGNAVTCRLMEAATPVTNPKCLPLLQPPAAWEHGIQGLEHTAQCSTTQNVWPISEFLEQLHGWSAAHSAHKLQTGTWRKILTSELPNPFLTSPPPGPTLLLFLSKAGVLIQT